jgi:hypothetical protein
MSTIKIPQNGLPQEIANIPFGQLIVLTSPFLGNTAKTIHMMEFILSFAKDFEQKAWINLEATMKYEYCKDYQGKGIVLYCDKPLEAAQPGEQLCYFT